MTEPFTWGTKQYEEENDGLVENGYKDVGGGNMKKRAKNNGIVFFN